MTAPDIYSDIYYCELNDGSIVKTEDPSKYVRGSKQMWIQSYGVVRCCMSRGTPIEYLENAIMTAEEVAIIFLKAVSDQS